jgi:hypothetical protein
MINETPAPVISPKFTVEDIHSIRVWNYERLKDATPEERRRDIEERTKEILRRLATDSSDSGRENQTPKWTDEIPVPCLER